MSLTLHLRNSGPKYPGLGTFADDSEAALNFLLPIGDHLRDAGIGSTAEPLKATCPSFPEEGSENRCERL